MNTFDDKLYDVAQRVEQIKESIGGLNTQIEELKGQENGLYLNKTMPLTFWHDNKLKIVPLNGTNLILKGVLIDNDINKQAMFTVDICVVNGKILSNYSLRGYNIDTKHLTFKVFKNNSTGETYLTFHFTGEYGDTRMTWLYLISNMDLSFNELIPDGCVEDDINKHIVEQKTSTLEEDNSPESLIKKITELEARVTALETPTE